LYFLFQIGKHFVVDASIEEELCNGAQVSVGISPKGNVCGLMKGGKGAVETSVLEKMIGVFILSCCSHCIVTYIDCTANRARFN
jgi:exosome complex component RRP42